MRQRPCTTRSDIGAIRIHDQADERPAPAVMFRNGYGDCTNLVQLDPQVHEDTPPLKPIEGVELVVHRAGAWLSDHDCRNGYRTSLSIGRYRIHRTENRAPAHWWLELVGTTTPRSAYAVVRPRRRRGWTLALYAPFAGWTEEDGIEVATLVVDAPEAALQADTAGRRLYPLECPEGAQRASWTLARLDDGRFALKRSTTRSDHR